MPRAKKIDTLYVSGYALPILIKQATTAQKRNTYVIDLKAAFSYGDIKQEDLVDLNNSIFPLAFVYDGFVSEKEISVVFITGAKWEDGFIGSTAGDAVKNEIVKFIEKKQAAKASAQPAQNQLKLVETLTFDDVPVPVYELDTNSANKGYLLDFKYLTDAPIDSILKEITKISAVVGGYKKGDSEIVIHLKEDFSWSTLIYSDISVGYVIQLEIDDVLSQTPSAQPAQSQASSVSTPNNTIIGQYEKDLEIVKKEISQLLVMKGFISPVDFETKIQLNQRIEDAQKRLNELNFKIVEAKLDKDDIFEDLFEQSFTPINNTYSDVYAASTFENEPASTNFFAPDGTPSKLSDALNELIRTPQFMDWFGNWQLAYAYKDEDAVDISCSKVVNEHYEPLLVWHGTGAQFSYFRFDNFPAAYFAVKYKYSKWFADLQGGANGGYTIPFFLNIRNPLDLTNFGTRKIRPKDFFDYMFIKTGMNMEELEVNPLFMDSNTPPLETWVFLRQNAKMLKKLSDNKVYDGIHFYETNPNVPEGQAEHSTEAFIIFNPNQCKIADPERGLLLFGSLKSFLLKKGGKI